MLAFCSFGFQKKFFFCFLEKKGFNDKSGLIIPQNGLLIHFYSINN